ncbi:MAG: NAD(P)-dependent oxidoreductase [Planctomycetes bacterium]|nr:NAD(P)-dependent oxidoreductase [Planctomycetota bacterium]
MDQVETEEELEELLSRPMPGAVESLGRLAGDILVLGAGGKMGPTLARMLRRACDALGQSRRRVVAASRWSSSVAAESLTRHGVETIRCDLTSRESVAELPDFPNIIYMAGQKFGTSNAPELTWVMNTLVPAIVAERFVRSRFVVFSTGCVYPLSSVSGYGSREGDALVPMGEYANSCVGRERVFSHFTMKNGAKALMFRLSYAIDMRYGVLSDVARKVLRGDPVDVTMGKANVIWQGDANARAIQCLERVGDPPVILNVTGLEPVSIRELARRFARLLGREAVIRGVEADNAWLIDASRSYDWFGPPAVSIDEMVEATAKWVAAGGADWGKPTHFEVRDGHY